MPGRLGCKYGSHRVIEPRGVLPQAAWRIDNSAEIYDNEALIDVDILNIDSASYAQLKTEADGDPARIASRMMEIVRERGKHHNPVTGSGGMLIGTIEKLGPAFPRRDGNLAPGVRIATLVSLSLTPLRIDEILSISPDSEQVKIKGKAVLFETGVYAILPPPEKMPETVALAVLDVAGAPAQTARLVRPGDRVAVIGAGGKSGLLCLVQARKCAGPGGEIIAIAHGDRGASRVRRLGVADAVIQADAARPLELLSSFEAASGGKPADVTINCVNVPGTEMGSVLITRDGGTVYFFSMATSFTAAALGAEGIGRDVTMIMGNGYCRDHAEIALRTVFDHDELCRIFTELYAPQFTETHV